MISVVSVDESDNDEDATVVIAAKGVTYSTSAFIVSKGTGFTGKTEYMFTEHDDRSFLTRFSFDILEDPEVQCVGISTTGLVVFEIPSAISVRFLIVSGLTGGVIYDGSVPGLRRVKHANSILVSDNAIVFCGESIVPGTCGVFYFRWPSCMDSDNSEADFTTLIYSNSRCGLFWICEYYNQDSFALIQFNCEFVLAYYDLSSIPWPVGQPIMISHDADTNLSKQKCFKESANCYVLAKNVTDSFKCLSYGAQEQCIKQTSGDFPEWNRYIMDMKCVNDQMQRWCFSSGDVACTIFGNFNFFYRVQFNDQHKHLMLFQYRVPSETEAAIGKGAVLIDSLSINFRPDLTRAVISDTKTGSLILAVPSLCKKNRGIVIAVCMDDKPGAQQVRVYPVDQTPAKILKQSDSGSFMALYSSGEYFVRQTLLIGKEG